MKFHILLPVVAAVVGFSAPANAKLADYSANHQKCTEMVMSPMHSHYQHLGATEIALMRCGRLADCKANHSNDGSAINNCRADAEREYMVRMKAVKMTPDRMMSQRPQSDVQGHKDVITDADRSQYFDGPQDDRKGYMFSDQ